MRTAAYATLLPALGMHLCAQSHTSTPAKPTTLRDANLTDQARKDILAAVLSDMNNGELDAAQTQKVALDSTVSFLKLRSTGPSAIEVEAEESPDCGGNAIGNCPVYLFMEVNGRPVLIFQSAGQGIGIESAMHHGMHDIFVAYLLNHFTHVAFEVDQYNGKAYQPAYCYETDRDENGRPTETPHKPCA